MFIAIFLYFSCIAPAFGAASTESAENLTSSCKLSGPDAGTAKHLLFDGSAETGMAVGQGVTVSFEASKPIHGLYLVWDAPHAQWDAVLSKDGAETSKTYGENGFLHEYADLGEGYDAVTLKFNGSGAVLCDIHAFSEGGVPDWVQAWQPPLEKADLLVLPGRAGDEFLYFGGAIPYYIEKGKSVQVAYMTNLFDEPSKTRGILNALYASGLRTYPVISDFPEVTASSMDNALEHYDAEEFFSFAAELFRRFKPDVVVGQGEYGDGVQMLSSAAVLVAAELSGDRLEYGESAEKYGAWDVPKLYLHGHTASGPDVQGIEIDWGGSLETARQAFSHYTWKQNRSIAAEGAYDCRKFELHRTTVGPDVQKDDFFENIGLDVPKVPEAAGEPEKLGQAEPIGQAKQRGQSGSAEEAGPVSSARRLWDSAGSNLAVLLSLPVALPSAAVLMIAAAILLRFKRD